jgi:hypothetical protein
MKFEIYEPTADDAIRALLAGHTRLAIAKPSPKAWAALQAAFQIMCEELGIADKPDRVVVRFTHCMEAGPEADGATLSGKRNPIFMELKIQNGYEVLKVLAHEMFHVRDITNGVMCNDKDGTSLYHGQRVPKSKSFLTQADEIEAYEGMYSLALKVLDRLPPAIAESFTEGYVEDVRPPTLREYYEAEGAEQQKRIEKAKTASQMTA